MAVHACDWKTRARHQPCPHAPLRGTAALSHARHGRACPGHPDHEARRCLPKRGRRVKPGDDAQTGRLRLAARPPHPDRVRDPTSPRTRERLRPAPAPSPHIAERGRGEPMVHRRKRRGVALGVPRASKSASCASAEVPAPAMARQRSSSRHAAERRGVRLGFLDHHGDQISAIVIAPFAPTKVPWTP